MGYVVDPMASEGETLTMNNQRTAIVTGASKGIGAATAILLGASGFRVAVGYASDASGAAAVVSDIERTSGSAIAVEIDVANPESVATACAAVESDLGPITVLVNNAGITRDGLTMRMSDDNWNAVINTNLTGAFSMIKRCTPAMMKARYGRVINVASASGQLGSAGQANYAAAKAGLVGLTRSVARELGSRGVTANVVAPGPITTAMTQDMPTEWVDRLTAQVPLGRFGTVDEVAATINFLCSDAAAYITGAIIPIDGGLGMGH